MHYPKHIAIIPDGNRTWAKENGASIEEAYMLSYQRGVDLIKYTFTHTDAEVFTLRWLSTENANKRPKEEFDFLMTMYKLIDDDLDTFLLENKINFKRIGNGDGITQDFRDYLNQKTAKTRCDSNRYFVFGINYGGRDEIIRGIQKIYKENIAIDTLTEEEFSKHLDLSDIPVIDLVVRTKGDVAQRTSGFMSRWIGYAELYFTKKKCPEFMPEDLQEAFQWFSDIHTHRNFGK